MQPVASLAAPVFEIDLLDQHVRELAGDVPLARFSLQPLNDLMGGVFPGRMTALGATPGAGKTTLMQQMAEDLAEQGMPVIFVSAELPAPKLISKSLSRLSDGALAVSDVADAAGRVAGGRGPFQSALDHYRESIAGNLCILADFDLTEITQMAASCARERGVTPVLFIDYLQLVATSGAEPFMDERLAIASCVRDLRYLANCFRVPVFAISTITRGDYGKKAPTLSVFGGTATIEYSFDTALLLTEDQGTGASRLGPVGERPMVLSALKNRYGALGSAHLSFDCAHATFRERG